MKETNKMARIAWVLHSHMFVQLSNVNANANANMEYSLKPLPTPRSSSIWKMRIFTLCNSAYIQSKQAISLCAFCTLFVCILHGLLSFFFGLHAFFSILVILKPNAEEFQWDAVVSISMPIHIWDIFLYSIHTFHVFMNCSTWVEYSSTECETMFSLAANEKIPCLNHIVVSRYMGWTEWQNIWIWEYDATHHFRKKIRLNYGTNEKIIILWRKLYLFCDEIFSFFPP